MKESITEVLLVEILKPALWTSIKDKVVLKSKWGTEGKVDNLMDNKNDLDLSMNQSLANKFERLYREEKSKRKLTEKELQEVKEDNQKLSKQISDMINKLRDAQF